MTNDITLKRYHVNLEIKREDEDGEEIIDSVQLTEEAVNLEDAITIYHAAESADKAEDLLAYKNYIEANLERMLSMGADVPAFYEEFLRNRGEN